MLLSSELFPSEVRAFCKGITRSFACIMLVLSLKFFPLMEEKLTFYGTFYLFAAILLLSLPGNFYSMAIHVMKEVGRNVRVRLDRTTWRPRCLRRVVYFIIFIQCVRFNGLYASSRMKQYIEYLCNKKIEAGAVISKRNLINMITKWLRKSGFIWFISG